jgi:phage baseplate assembly protein W
MSVKKDLLGSDLLLVEHKLGVDLFIDKGDIGKGDIGIVSDEMNLAQAILHRIRTVKGELADIGHPNYGSNIFDFVGQPNNRTTRARLQLEIRDTLMQEPRIREIISIVAKSRVYSKERITEEKGTPAIKVTMGKFSEGQTHMDGEQSPIAIESGPSATDVLNTVEVLISVIPIGKTVPLNIVFPFYLEGVEVL